MSKIAAQMPDLYQDLLDLPDGQKGEIVQGVLHRQPAPNVNHQRIGSKMSHGIGGPFDFDDDGPGGWWILAEPELHLGDDVFRPDLAGWRRSEMAILPRENFIAQKPNWICEILSPSTQRYDRLIKSERYAAHGVDYLWLVDPMAELMEAFRLENGRWSRIGAFSPDDDVSVEPFDAISFVLKSLWE